MQLAFWRNATRCVDLVAYSNQHRGLMDLVTKWPNGVAVTTTNSGSTGVLVLPPGDLKQGLWAYPAPALRRPLGGCGVSVAASPWPSKTTGDASTGAGLPALT